MLSLFDNSYHHNDFSFVFEMLKTYKKVLKAKFRDPLRDDHKII